MRLPYRDVLAVEEKPIFWGAQSVAHIDRIRIDPCPRLALRLRQANLNPIGAGRVGREGGGCGEVFFDDAAGVDEELITESGFSRSRKNCRFQSKIMLIQLMTLSNT
jgi:hypothetical protein